MEGGRYRDVWFNHRAMRAFWLAAFIAWEGFRAIAESAKDDSICLDRFSSMIETFSCVVTMEDPEAVPLPPGVPKPGRYPDAALYPQERASAELATFATGWAFLHEIRHLQHQQDGTSAGPDASQEQHHTEEFSCDEYATRFLLDEIDTFVANENANSSLVRQKRGTGIYFALFAMTLISRDKWEQSDTHPSLQDRINEVMHLMESIGTRNSYRIALVAFAALSLLWPDTPRPLKPRTVAFLNFGSRSAGRHTCDG